MSHRLKTADRASNKLMPLHQQIATGLKPKRKPISK